MKLSNGSPHYFVFSSVFPKNPFRPFGFSERLTGENFYAPGEVYSIIKINYYILFRYSSKNYLLTSKNYLKATSKNCLY